jgi:cell division protein FtsZ
MSMAYSNELPAFDSQAVIKVCGIGGGGGNAISRMIEAGMTEVDFITINTDAQALRHSPAGTRLQIGEVGLGAGAKPEQGREAAEQSRDRIKEVLQGADMIFLTAGMGGGTGTGATPVVAEIARETGALTVGIVTLPFKFEGGNRMENAIKGMTALEPHVDALIIVPNDRLALLCEDNISFLNAFRLADEVLHNGVRSISELITIPGLINLDFADVRTIMRDSGRALMGIGAASGENRSIRAAEEAIICPLLEHSSVDGALGVVVNVKGGSDITMKEVLDAVTTVQKSADRRANIIFGAVVEDEPREEVQVTVIAAGFRESSTSNENPLDDSFITLLSQNDEEDEHEVTAETEEVSETVPAEVPAYEQGMFDVEHDDPFESPSADYEPAPEPDEDLSIPAFMRRRRREEE